MHKKFPSEMGSTLRKKICSLLRVDSFSDEREFCFTEFPPLNVYLFPLKAHWNAISRWAEMITFALSGGMSKSPLKNSKLLTLETPRKPASENVVCLCRLLNILANFSNLFLHTGKQCGPRSDWSGSTLFAEMTFKITGRRQSRRQ